MFNEGGFPVPNSIDNILKVEKNKTSIENLIPKLEERDGFLVNTLENKRIKGEISAENLSEFVAIMHDRIIKEINREKTTLPKDKLQQLDDELQVNPLGTKAVIESFGLGVASDPFMLYGILRKGKDLIARTVWYYNVVKPSSVSGFKSLESLAPKPLDLESDDEITDTIYEFWNSNMDIGQNEKSEFPLADNIRYYSGNDVVVDDENPRFGFKKGGRVAAFRTIFSSRAKDKTDECGYMFGGTWNTERIDMISKREISNYALKFRDNSDVISGEVDGLLTGFPAESYIPVSSKKRVLMDYFQRALIPEIRKDKGRRGIY